jgi:hypothetical protein
MNDNNTIVYTMKPPLTRLQTNNGVRSSFIIDSQINDQACIFQCFKHIYADKDRANQLFKQFVETAKTEQIERVFRHFKLEEDSKGDNDFFGLEPVKDNEPFRY